MSPKEDKILTSDSFLQAESEMYSSHVLCYRKGRGRKLCHFKVLPPGTRIAMFTLKFKIITFEQLFRFYILSDVGEYLLKVYAKPEAEVYGNDDRLDHVATIPIHCIQVVERHMPKISLHLKCS